MGRQRGLGPEFGKLWAASGISNFGDGITAVAAPLLAAALTRDPVLVTGLAAAQRLPWLLFSLISGALADRLDRRRLTAVAGAFRAVLVGSLGVTVLLDRASIPLLYAVFFLLGAAETLADTTTMTVLPAVVPSEHLPRANARLSGTVTVANVFVGPPLAGFLFAAAAAAPFLLSAGSFAAAAALVLALHGTFRAVHAEGTRTATIRGDIAEGVRWLRRHRLLRTVALTLGVMNLTNAATVSIMVLVARERLSLGPAGYGLLLSSEAVGGLAGSVAATHVIAALGVGRALRLGLLVEAATGVVIALTRDPLVVGATLALFGFNAVVWNVVTVSLRQELIPARLMGRVTSAYAMLATGSAALGAPLGGLLAKGFGLAAPFWFASCSIAIVAPLAWSVLGDATTAGAQGKARAPTRAS